MMDDFEDTLRSHIIGLLKAGEDHPYVDESKPGVYLVRWTLPRRTNENKQAWERRLSQIERGLSRLPNTSVRLMGWGEAGGPYWYVNFQVLDRTAKKVLKAAKAYGVKKSPLASVVDDVYVVHVSAGSWARLAQEGINRDRPAGEVFAPDSLKNMRGFMARIANQAQNIHYADPRMRRTVERIISGMAADFRRIEASTRSPRTPPAGGLARIFQQIQSNGEVLEQILKRVSEVAS